MAISPREKKFLALALRAGYLTTVQISAVCALRASSQLDVSQLAFRDNYLSRQQIALIIKAMANPQPDKKVVTASDPSTAALSSKPISGEAQGFQLGQDWGKFAILQEIGRGGMGVVYKAKCLTSGQIVALKILLSGSRADSVQIRRFLREARTSATLKHANIVQTYDIGEQQSYHYFTMQYVEGETFAAWVGNEQINLQAKLEVLIKVCHALDYAHRQKILHRDLKPSNILVDHDRIPYLSDFGLAKLIDSDSALTQTGSTLGTPFYMAPEQVKGNKSRIGPGCDIYSMGIVLYQTITGRLPFTADMIPQLFHKILCEDPPAPRSHDPEIPLPLQAICLKAIQKKLEARYATAIELADDLDRFLQGEKVAAMRFYRSKTLWKMTRHLVRGSKFWIICGAMALALSLAIWLWAWLAPKPWHEPWQLARKHFIAGQYAKAVGQLQRIEIHPLPPKVKELQARVYEQLHSQAKADFQQRRYTEALAAIELIVPASIQALKLKVDILEKQNRFEEMRLALNHLASFHPNSAEFFFMGQKALRYGYFHDAYLYFFQSNKAKCDDIITQKFLAKTLFYLGKSDEALAIYIGLQRRNDYCWQQDTELISDLAALYYQQRQYDKAVACLNHWPADDPEKKRNFFLQSRHLHLGASLAWEKLRQDLLRWRWLCSGYRSDTICLLLTKELQKIAGQLQVSHEYLQQCQDDYLITLHKKQSQVYRLAITLENENFAGTEVKNKLDQLRQAMDQASLPPDREIFFNEVMVRFAIRHRQWSQAEQLCQQALYRYSWAANLYLLQAIVRFQHNDLDGFEDSNLKCLHLQRWNLLSTENMIDLFLPRLTQEEFDRYCLILSRYMFSSTMNFRRLLLRNHLEQATQHYSSSQRMKRQMTGKISWDHLLQSLLLRSSSATRELTVEILASQHQNPILQQKLQQFSRRYSDKNTGQGRCMQAVNAAIARYKRRELTEKIRHLLLRYGFFADDRYIGRIVKMGPQARELLADMVCNRQELAIVRLLAARMIMAQRDVDSLRLLQKMAANDPFPINLLATVAMREADMLVAMPTASISNELKQSLIGETENANFFRTIIALYLHPHIDCRLYREFAVKLLYCSNDQISLSAAYNFRRFIYRLAPLSREKINRRLKQLCHDEQEGTRALALKLLWQLSDIAIDSESFSRKEDIIEKALMPRHWHDYHQELFRNLDTGTPRTSQLQALQNLVGDEYLRRHLPKIDKTDHAQLWKLLEKMYRGSESSIVKYWSLLALEMIDKKGEVWKIVYEPETSLAIRMGAVIGIWARDSFSPEFLRIIKVIFQPKSEKDRQFAQVFVVMLGWLNPLVQQKIKEQSRRPWAVASFAMSQLKKKFSKHLDHPDEKISRAMISGLMWLGDEKIIPRLVPLLRSPHNDIQRATAATLAAITIRHAPQYLAKVHKLFLSHNDSIRRAAAFGYYNIIRRVNVVLLYSLGDRDSEKAYDLYLQCLRSRIAEQNAATLQRWLLALKKANELKSDSRYYYEAALIYQQQKRFPEAQNILSRMQQKLVNNGDLTDPKVKNAQARCYFLQGEIYSHTGDVGKARQSFIKGLEFYPFAARPHLYLGEIANKAGNSTETLRYWWRAHLCDPDSPDALFLLFDYCLRQQGMEQALALAQYSRQHWKLKPIASKRAEKILLSAQGYLKKENYQKAQSELQSCLSQICHLPQAHYCLAKVFSHYGDFIRAQKRLLYCYLCDSTNPEPLLELAVQLWLQRKQRETSTLLQYLHRRFAIGRREILQYPDYSSLGNHPWLQKLAD